MTDIDSWSIFKTTELGDTTSRFIKQKNICRDYKIVHDSIHGSITLSEFACKVIDTPIFQRLRHLKQLGTCNYVYPNAIHTRFEHSIGTYYLAGKLLDKIVKTTKESTFHTYLKEIDEMKDYYKTKYGSKNYYLDEYVCELVKIAALCHDLGHGPFSHVFDDIFIPTTKHKDHINATHEERSCALIEKIIRSDSELSLIVNDEEVNFIKTLINPDKSKNTSFIYQIVSNNLNSLDVDKYDYLERDSKTLQIGMIFDSCKLIEGVRLIDNKLCYPKQSVYDVVNLFNTRHQLHRRLYGHKAVISSQFLIIELMTELDSILKISDSITDLDKFVNLTDTYILESMKILMNPILAPCLVSSTFERIKRANDLYQKLGHHDFYPLIMSKVTKDNLVIDKKELEGICNPDDIIVYYNKVGYVSGNKSNPFDNLYVYTTKHIAETDDSNKYLESLIGKSQIKAIKYDKTSFTLMLPTLYQECINMVYYKKNDSATIGKLQDYFSSKYDL